MALSRSAIFKTACSFARDWPIAKLFIDLRDEAESDFPELRDLRYLREEARGDYSLPQPFAGALRRILSQPTPAGKLDLPSAVVSLAALLAGIFALKETAQDGFGLLGIGCRWHVFLKERTAFC